ncbi:MAG TPA: glycosyltransferase N-terminal domain-containing protein [Bacteroidales bacterium]|nr:glycosyltransferase N-terminal domain-containing protein [Bacteroidales bacterium]
MNILYNLGIYILNGLAHLLAFFNPKARLWIAGTKDWESKIRKKINPEDRNIWIHCASLGEFEQGRPVIEELKKEDPELKVVLTFFSPSGYEIRKNYDKADCIIYLPPDTPSNARELVRIVRPEFAILVKYEFWSNYISELYNNNIPLYLISGIFRPGQHFFRWYGSFFRGILRKFKMFFVQDQLSFDLLKGIGLSNVMITGDTRFDRVVQIAGTARDIKQIEQFRGEEKMFLAGSSWRQDEEIIAQYINENPDRMKWVFAPHEIHSENIERLEKFFRVKTVRFSAFTEAVSDARVLIIDNIGMLSSAYRYTYIAAIGGGFGKGIHNILEAACWGIPVMFGPRHKKFREAVELIKENGAVSFDSYSSFKAILEKWLLDEPFYLKSANAASSYVIKNKGATSKILAEILSKRY